MLLDKYVHKMSHERFVYTYTLIELDRRGYRRANAHKILEESNLGDRMFRDSMMFWHYDEKQWADWVIQDYEDIHKAAVSLVE